MTQETAPQPGAQNVSDANTESQGVNAVQDTLDRFLAAADVQAVYGDPVHEGATTAIPCAEVLSVVGFGLGSGYGSGGGAGEADEQGKPAQQGRGGGGGGGGGGRVLSRPVAVIEVRSEGVNVKPIIDVTKLGLAGITAWGFMLVTVMRMMGKRRGFGRPK